MGDSRTGRKAQRDTGVNASLVDDSVFTRQDVLRIGTMFFQHRPLKGQSVGNGLALQNSQCTERARNTQVGSRRCLLGGAGFH
jgi:hypothetical protein